MENEFKGTKGPWFWDGEGLGNKHHIVFGKGYPIEMTSKENKALIASAPELLEALKNLEVAVNTIKYCWERRPENMWSAMQQAESDTEIARAAINKALGK